MATDRESVLLSAVGLLSRQPTAAMDEIARAAGISRATLHRLFPGREALFHEIGTLALERMESALNEAAVQKAVTDARQGVKVETFNLDGSPAKATDTAEPPPAGK